MNKKTIKKNKTKRIAKGKSKELKQSTRKSNRSRKAPLRLVEEHIVPKKPTLKKTTPKKTTPKKPTPKNLNPYLAQIKKKYNFQKNRHVIINNKWKNLYENKINNKFLELLKSKGSKSKTKFLDSYKNLLNIINKLDIYYNNLKLELKIEGYFSYDLDILYLRWKKKNIDNYYAYTIFRLLTIRFIYLLQIKFK